MKKSTRIIIIALFIIVIMGCTKVTQEERDTALFKDSKSATGSIFGDKAGESGKVFSGKSGEQGKIFGDEAGKSGTLVTGESVLN